MDEISCAPLRRVDCAVKELGSVLKYLAKNCCLECNPLY